MTDVHHTYEFRCPVHGFIELSAWEREIISHPAFQRLRRIRQLGWTDHIYPGAMHTRFEHSLGVMHVATAMLDAIVGGGRTLLEEELGFDDAGICRDRILVRLAALLHDLGHTPFSHGAEDLFPEFEEEGRRYVHEEYSAAIIRHRMRDVIENHPANANYRISADDVANLLEGSSESARSLIWREIITGQMDADRIDYLLRDSLHAGVDYGRFDWRRLIGCLALVRTEDERGWRLGVTEGGLHAAESLVLARYLMFTQVYFHKTRVAYDHHLQMALAELLPDGLFPPPHAGQLDAFLRWDDWRVLGRLADGEGGDHGRRLSSRDHYRQVWHSAENPGRHDVETFHMIQGALGSKMPLVASASKSWYRFDESDVPVQSDNPGQAAVPLSHLSDVIKGMRPIGKIMAYSAPENVASARAVVQNCVQSVGRR
ncbi:deoxyguanosinetriphosphate triphosphohydrolase-like protein [Maioricimonas rarisocia]|uniref:Deoxyguanosinetriphosphate triphosphohydrolase-like protein n=1 Tax=Maioricimonas rarisocia TaxID=2528026 RepID=A0A517Z2T2_9PLAN|nr:HD domain-containing protein [Maioricimonas rarisocia]QDU36781.1 deoxyguanosinetriphosphate triphosphohydrolase-like protein [Maioricimonas rarisocia]